MAASVIDSNPLEPLDESAPVAWAMAPQLCLGDPASTETCVWYHRVWQYLRLLDIITSIRTNTAFLTATFDRLAASHPRVLVSGSADYGMLAHLVRAYGDRPLDVTVVDRCPTSVHLNHWYGERYGLDVTTACADVLAFESDRPFDIVCTHNFVSRFDDAARQRLVGRWHSLLRPGGVVVTTQRIRPASRERLVVYTPDEARELADRVTRAAAAYTGRGLVPAPEALGEAAYQYALRKGGFVFRSPQDIAGLFERAGFDVDVADEGGGLAERERDRPSSTAGKDTYRMRLVATRR